MKREHLIEFLTRKDTRPLSNPEEIDIVDLCGLDKEQIRSYFQEERQIFPQDIEIEVKKVVDAVCQRGDEALIEYTEQYDGFRLSRNDIRVSNREIEGASAGFHPTLSQAIELSIERVRQFHEKSKIRDWTFVDDAGNTLGQRCIPLERVGIYIPGGKASYPSSLIMTAVPALVAGVAEIVVLSPPSSFERPSSLCLALSRIEGNFEVYRVGGAQGIAALGFGTDAIRKVDKIVGPGNIYVSVAKKMLYGQVDIDMIAGPSEVLVIADGSVDPRLTAIDLLAQAEHDERSKALCVTLSMEHACRIKEWVEDLMKSSRRRNIVGKSISKNGKIYVVRDRESAVQAANAIAPEHLEIQTEDPRGLLPKIKNAGAIFLGRYSPEAFGDYIAGPSHVLPTGGAARFFSPLNVLSFVKFSSIIEMSEQGAEQLGSAASAIAEVEGLFEHARSVDFRRDGR